MSSILRQKTDPKRMSSLLHYWLGMHELVRCLSPSFPRLERVARELTNAVKRRNTCRAKRLELQGDANAGSVVTAGFEFDVPVRFDTDSIQTSVASFQAGEIPSVPIVEVRV